MLKLIKPNKTTHVIAPAITVPSNTQVTIIGGPLGAGKTTVLDMLLTQVLASQRTTQEETRNAARCLVITNDLGPGVDNTRIARWHGSEQVEIRHVALDCACCDAREVFVQKLRDITDFDHIIIEPTGAANIGALASIFPTDTRIKVVGVISPSDIADSGRNNVLKHADVIGITRVLGSETKRVRDTLAQITTAVPYILPDPYKAVEPGMPKPDIGPHWKAFLDGIDSTSHQVHPGLTLATQHTVTEEGIPIVLPPMTADTLQAVLQGNCKRAKGVTTIVSPNGRSVLRSFDFAYGRVRLHESPAAEATHCTVIGSRAQLDALVTKIATAKSLPNPIVQKALNYLNHTLTVAQTSDTLPETYARFNKSNTRKVIGQAQKYFGMAAKRTKHLNKNNYVQAERVEAAMESLGDRMFFDSPWIWLMYKLRAYGKTQLPYRAAPVLTWGDLLSHASPKGYICTKRLMYLRSAWLQWREILGVSSNFDDQWPTETSLNAIANDTLFQRFSALVQPEWLAYERSSLGKWNNY